MKWHCCHIRILFVLLCQRKELLHFGLHIYLQRQYFIPFPFPHCEKLALFYNQNFTEVYINLDKVCYSLAELYVRCVYLNLSWWRGAWSSWNIYRGAQAIKIWEPLSHRKQMFVVYPCVPHLQPDATRVSDAYKLLDVTWDGLRISLACVRSPIVHSRALATVMAVRAAIGSVYPFITVYIVVKFVKDVLIYRTFS
jgi:hypothetical protein